MGVAAPPAAHLADTLVVKLAQLWAYISLVVPVMSSHWAGAVPPDHRTHGISAPSGPSHTHTRHVAPTNHAAEEAETGGISLPGVAGTLPPRWRQRDPQPDGPVELASARLDGDDGAEGRLVPQLPSQQLVRDWLSLRGRGSHRKKELNKQGAGDDIITAPLTWRPSRTLLVTAASGKMAST